MENGDRADKEGMTAQEFIDYLNSIEGEEEDELR